MLLNHIPLMHSCPDWVLCIVTFLKIYIPFIYNSITALRLHTNINCILYLKLCHFRLLLILLCWYLLTCLSTCRWTTTRDVFVVNKFKWVILIWIDVLLLRRDLGFSIWIAHLLFIDHLSIIICYAIHWYLLLPSPISCKYRFWLLFTN